MNADAITVHGYRQILLFPVLLECEQSEVDSEHATLPSQWRAWVKTFQSGKWLRRETMPQAGTPPGVTNQLQEDCDPTYEEVVYFHPFARDLLYGDGSDDIDERAMLCFRREDVNAMRVELDIADLPHRDTGDAKSVTFGFRVPRVELYLCKPPVAMLAVEVVWEASPEVSQLCLADVLVLQSRIREAYPPYFTGWNGHDAVIPGNCPLKVEWLDMSGAAGPVVLSASDFHAGRRHFAKQVAEGAEPPLASHWRFLLQEIEPLQKREGHGKRFRQIIDDRIPGLTYVAVDDPRQIHEGDLDRLAFCETGGDTPFPYSQDFLDANRHRHVYDRYWRQTADHDSPKANGLKLNTLYLCSGFQFVAVGSQHNWYFANLVQDHLRRHYFRLALIAHFQRASLLKFADDMAEAIKLIKGRPPRQELRDPILLRRVEGLQMTFVKFVSRAWFSEVSNQLQGQELFRWWSDLLGNDKLFDEVQQMNGEMHRLMTEQDSRHLAAADVTVAAVATVIAVISLLVSLFT